MDNSATISTSGDDWNTWAEAAYSEAYTNLNGLRLSDAIDQALSSNFSSNANNKIHLIGHSHGTKVATVAALDLLDKQIAVNHLTTCDSPEDEVTLATNSANLLGYYFNQLPVAPLGQQPTAGQIFVESYVSMFGYGYAGPSGAAVNNVVQVGLDSDGIFDDTSFSDRHAYSATWYSNARNATTSNSWPLLGFAWPQETLPGQASSYQDITVFSGESYVYQQWHLYDGDINDADQSLYGYSYYTNPSLSIEKSSQSSGVSGSTRTTLTIPANADGSTSERHFIGNFAADTDDLYGLSFDLQWTAAQPNDYVIVTVQTPAVDNDSTDQEIALVFDGMAFYNDTIWKPLSFNTYSTDRDQTQFAIHYYPDPRFSDHQGKLSVKNFGYIKEEYDW